MIETFRASFYSLWFQNIPDSIIESAMAEVSGFSESRLIASGCPKIKDEYLVLKTVIFLNTFMGLGKGFSLNVPTEEGEAVNINMASLSNSGTQSFVKKDSIDSSLSREYFEPSIPDGMDVEDFPLGSIKARIDRLEEVCKKANAFVGGFSSGIPMGTCENFGSPKGGNCGMAKGNDCKNVKAQPKRKRKDNTCRNSKK